MVGFEKALEAVKVIKDQIQYRSQSLLNLARDYFTILMTQFFYQIELLELSHVKQVLDRMHQL